MGDESFEVYPRKGEFFVFDPPGGEPLERILLPVPTERTKGVLVFPTVDGRVIAGPTAIDGTDKDDWTVRPEAWEEIMPKVIRAHPPLEGAEPIASYAGLRPAGRGVNYVIGPSATIPRTGQRRGDPLHRPLGIAGHRRARRRAPRRGGGRAGSPARAARRSARPGPRAVVAPRLTALRGGCVSARYLLGLDEGTTGVKAALFDESLRPVGEARRDKVEPPPQARLGRAGWQRGPGGRRRGDRRAARRPSRRDRRLRARPPGGVGPGLGRRIGPAAQPDRGLAGQALAGGARPPRRRRGGGEGRERPPVRPLLLGREAGLAARAPRAGGCGAGGRDAANGNRRLVPLRPTRCRIRDRPVHRLAHAAAADRHAGMGPAPLRAVRGARRGAAGAARHRGRAGRRSATRAGPRSFASAVRRSTSRRRWPAPVPSSPGA